MTRLLPSRIALLTASLLLAPVLLIAFVTILNLPAQAQTLLAPAPLSTHPLPGIRAIDAGGALAARAENHTDVSTALNLYSFRNDRLLAQFRGHQQGFPDYVQGLTFSPNSKLLAAGRDNRIVIIDTTSLKVTQELEVKSSVLSLAFAPDSQVIAAGTNTGEVLIWELGTRRKQQQIHADTGSIWGLAFSPDGLTIAAGGADQTAKIWNVRSGQLLHTFRGHTEKIYCLAYSPDGNWLCTGSKDKTAILWKVSDEQAQYTFPCKDGTVFSLAFSHNGQLLGFGSIGAKTNAAVVQVRSVATGQLFRTLPVAAHNILCLTFSDGDSKLAVSDGRKVTTWAIGHDLNNAD